jgi:hypothetical protein
MTATPPPLAFGCARCRARFASLAAWYAHREGCGQGKTLTTAQQKAYNQSTNQTALASAINTDEGLTTAAGISGAEAVNILSQSFQRHDSRQR